MLLVETLTVERPEEMRGKRRVTWNKGPRSDWNRSIVTPEPRKCPSLKYVSVVRQLNKYKIGILLQLITCNKGKQHLLNGPRLYDIFMCFTICLSHTHTDGSKLPREAPAWPSGAIGAQRRWEDWRSQGPNHPPCEINGRTALPAEPRPLHCCCTSTSMNSLFYRGGPSTLLPHSSKQTTAETSCSSLFWCFEFLAFRVSPPCLLFLLHLSLFLSFLTSLLCILFRRLWLPR